MFWDERMPILIQISVQHDPKTSKITTFPSTIYQDLKLFRAVSVQNSLEIVLKDYNNIMVTNKLTYTTLLVPDSSFITFY